MSDDVTPEWVRVKREVESIWRGTWTTLHDLNDRLEAIEKRVRELENEIRPRERWRRGG